MGDGGDNSPPTCRHVPAVLQIMLTCFQLHVNNTRLFCISKIITLFYIKCHIYSQRIYPSRSKLSVAASLNLLCLTICQMGDFLLSQLIQASQLRKRQLEVLNEMFYPSKNNYCDGEKKSLSHISFSIILCFIVI